MNNDNDFPKKMARIGARGLQIAYMEVPTGSRPLVWIHGMGSFRETFHSLFCRPPVEARHLALDLPGFGHSTALPRRAELTDYADAVVAFLDVLGISAATLVGHSFGGMVAGEVAARYSQRVDGVIFISSAGWVNPENALTPTPYIAINRIGIWITGMDFFGRRMMQALGVDPAVLTAHDRRRFRFGWRHAREMARMGRFYESEDFFPRVLSAGRPLAIIHGTKDRLFPLERVRLAVGSSIPIWAINGAGHVPFYSHPDHFRQVFGQAYNHVMGFPEGGPRNGSR